MLVDGDILLSFGTEAWHSLYNCVSIARNTTAGNFGRNNTVGFCIWNPRPVNCKRFCRHNVVIPAGYVYVDVPAGCGFSGIKRLPPWAFIMHFVQSILRIFHF